MEKLWTGRSAGALDEFADKLNSSIGIDSRMYKEDIAGSVAHAGMLAVGNPCRPVRKITEADRAGLL